MLIGTSDSSAALALAIISAIVSLGSVAWQASSEAQRQRREQAARREEKVDDRAHEAEAVVRRFREPLVLAADQLRSRISNMLDLGFMEKYGDSRREYVIHSTMFAFGELLCWMEILRQEQQFLDLGDERASRRLGERVRAVGHVLSTDTITSSGAPAAFMLWRQEQRAIGEVMILRSDGAIRCVGFARFNEEVCEGPPKRWFEGLRRDIVRAIEDRSLAEPRLRQLELALAELIHHLDPSHVRTPELNDITALGSAGLER